MLSSKIVAAMEGSLQKQQEKKDWSVLAKQQKDHEGDAQKTANAESKREDRSKKVNVPFKLDVAINRSESSAWGRMRCARHQSQGEEVLHRKRLCTGLHLASFMQSDSRLREFINDDWLPQDTQFSFDDDQYEVTAVIRHKGNNRTSGHYDAFVKREDFWDLVDDEGVSIGIPKDQMGDSIRYGQCIVIPLRKLLYWQLTDSSTFNNTPIKQRQSS